MNGGHIKVVACIAIIAILALGAPLGRRDEETPQEPSKTMLSAPQEAWVAPDPCTLDTVVCLGEEKEPEWTVRTVTAYTSRVEETDATPCISANGTNICNAFAEGQTLCAANFVPFGTVLALDTSAEPDGEDAIVCVVVDRMSQKHPNGVDLYMGNDLERALNFGRQNLYVRTIEL